MSLPDGFQYDAGSKTVTVDNTQLGGLGKSLSKSTGSVGVKFEGVRSAPKESSDGISFSAGSITLRGNKPRMLFPAGKISGVHCETHQAKSNPILVITITFVDDWRLPDSITWLSTTYWQELGFKPGEAPTPSPIVFISTGKFEDTARGVSLGEGVFLSGILDPSQGILQSASWIIGGAPRAFGQIQLGEDEPPQISIDLEGTNAADGLSSLFKNLKVLVDAKLVYEPTLTDVSSGLALTATINWAKKPVKLETTLLASGGGKLDLVVEGPLPLPTPTDLNRYVGGESLTKHLPAQFANALDSIHVEKLRFGIGLGTKRLESVGVTLTALESSSLVIVKNWVEIGNIRFDVDVYGSLSGKASASYRLRGTLDIGGVDLIVSASLVPTPRQPNLSVVVQLDELSVIDLTMIAKKFGLPDGAPEILVDDFQMGGSTAGSYFIRAALSEHPVGPKQDAFVLNALIFELDYLGDDSGPQMSLEGKMTIAQVDADIQISNTDGWKVEGVAGEQQPIEIGHLLSDLGSKFGITVPAPIASLQLKQLKFNYASASGAFSFTCEGDFTVHDTPVALVVTIDVQQTQPGDVGKQQTVKGKKGYSATFGGKITLNELEFDLLFNTQSMDLDVFIASYSHTGASQGGSVHDLIAGVSSDLAAVIPTSLAIDLTDVKFVFYKDETSKKFALGLDLSAGLNLADLPLIGSQLPKEANIRIDDLQLLFTSSALKKKDVGFVNPLLPKSVKPLPADGAAAGFSVGAGMQFGAAPSQTLSLPIAGGDSSKPTQTPQAKKANRPATKTAANISSKVKWFDLQKSFGPVTCQKIGVSYEEQSLWFLLNGSLTVGRLKISVIGMGIGSPLERFDPQFKLQGLGLTYESGPLKIGGSFIEVDPPPNGVKFEYAGDAVIKAEQFSLSAIGAYAVMNDGQASLFVFADIEVPLGGPPSVFVTGLAAGFGYNRTVTIPPPDEVADFPLLSLTSDEGQNAPTPADVLAILEGQQEYAPGKKKA